MGQSDEAEMGCGSRSLGAAARFRPCLIACAAVFRVVSGHVFRRQLATKARLPGRASGPTWALLITNSPRKKKPPAFR